MSRIGKRIIELGDKVKATLKDEGGLVVLKLVGPLGELSRGFKKDIAITIDNGTITLLPQNDSLETKALWGTYGSHIFNMFKGVTEGFKKVLTIEGIGFKTALSGTKMTWSLGFSHTIDVEVPKGLKVTVEKGTVTITGIDKEAVGQFAAKLIAMKPPEPYKGKGIRYEGQVIKIKEGKKAVA